MAISPDGKTLASSGGDPVDQNGSLQVWDLTSGELIRTNYYVACEISSLAFSPNGQLLVLTGSNLEANKGIIQLWHLETGKPRFTLEPAVTPYGVMFNPDATMFAVGCNDQSIKLWNSATGGLVQTFTGHQGSVYAVAISSDGKLLASGSEDGTIVLWGLETGEKLQTLSGHRGGVRAIAFSQDRKTLISGSQDRTLKVWQYS
uniref:WD40 repeat domain-containing protein n=1 Tax=Desertifilum tharense IPPAS B-1220 TaxID=1781255 RepID=A0ACD5H0P5_9CYAN